MQPDLDLELPRDQRRLGLRPRRAESAVRTGAIQMPISLFIPTLSASGAQRVMVNLANAFVELAGRPVELVVLRREGALTKVIDPRVRVVSLEKRRMVVSIPSLVRYLRRSRPVAMLSTLHYANVIVLLAALLTGFRNVVVREANVDPRSGPPDLSPYRRVHRRVRIAMMRRLYKHARRVIANSEAVKASLLRQGVVSEALIEIIPNPVEIGSARPVSGRLETLEGFGRRRIICAAGRLSHQKGFDVLFQAFAKLKDRLDVQLVVLGEGDLRPRLEQLAERLDLTDRLSMPGIVEDPNQYFAGADLFVLSSRWKGLPNVLLEAMSVGCPIVATDCEGGVRELLDGGRFGRLVPVEAPADLARAMEEALHDPGDRDAVRARARQYDLQVIARRYLAALLDPMSDSG